MASPITKQDIDGMVNGLPWCRKLEDWPTHMLQRGLSEAVGDSPALARAMRRVLASR